MNAKPDVTIYDVLVVGLGPAGAVAAYELSRAGLSVLALDKQPHPRYKVCGGGLSARIQSILDQNVAPLVEHTVYSVQFSYRGQESFLIESPTPIAYMVMRDRFDQALVGIRSCIGTGNLPGISYRGSDGGHRVFVPRPCYRLMHDYQEVSRLYYGVLQGRTTYQGFFAQAKGLVKSSFPKRILEVSRLR